MKYVYIIIQGEQNDLKKIKKTAFKTSSQAFCVSKIIAEDKSIEAKKWYFNNYSKLKDIPADCRALPLDVFLKTIKNSIRSVLLQGNNVNKLEYYFESENLDLIFDYVAKIYNNLTFSIYKIETKDHTDNLYVEEYNNNNKSFKAIIDTSKWGIVTNRSSFIYFKEFNAKLEWLRKNNNEALTQSLKSNLKLNFEKLFPDFIQRNKLLYESLYTLEIKLSEQLEKSEWEYMDYDSINNNNVFCENLWARFCIKYNFPLHPFNICLEKKLEEDWWGNLPKDWIEMLKATNQYNPEVNINNITELTIKDYSEKTYFYIVDNIVPVKFLKNLKKLIINTGNISDIRPLSFLLEIEFLDISGNQIFDLTPLANLKKIRELKIYNNEIINISTIEKLPHILKSKRLDLSNNCISDLTSIIKFKNLVSLNICNNRFSNIERIDKLLNLEELQVYGNEITRTNSLISLYEKRTGIDLGYIQNINNVKELYLNQINLEKYSLDNLDWILPPYRPKWYMKKMDIDANKY